MEIYECTLVYKNIFGLEVYKSMQKSSSHASFNTWCNFVTDRTGHIGVLAVASMMPKNQAVVHRDTVDDKYFPR